MSITFSTTASSKTTPCRWCEEARQELRAGAQWVQAVINGEWIKEGQVVSEDQMKDVRCDFHCRGTITESIAPEVNLATGNARSLFGLLGLAFEEGGEIEASSMMQCVMVALNSDRSGAVVEPSETPGGHAPSRILNVDGMPTIQRMGPPVVNMGRSDDSIVCRLTELRTLAEWSINNSDGIITWG